MLQIKNIKKQYKTGNLIQKALDDVSLNLRDNEFVSILGPSGSGKTTLLNIIGGLDRYDEGDIIINNVSTKEYKDKDWDSYRAHTVGFVFQSYNLIPHQTILSNVELALTISGLKKQERSGLALEALRKVGLEEHAHKKPNQLSGGQMQRVAIARALVNNPDIVLADEPTGALDSETSVQVMELLKEVAKDRLVVMVTHNPELAEQYSTRIVRLKDGKIISDSNPLKIKNKNQMAEHRNLGKAGMSLFTSMHLSFNNLLSKKARTFLVAIAGSIGIIGIALIMSLSNGANEYIQSLEEKTLSEYPLTISRSSFDLTSLMSAGIDIALAEDDDKVHEQQVIAGMFGTVHENDLKSLKKYIESDETDIQKYVNAIEYGYSITPYIYKIHDNEMRRVSPDSVINNTGLSAFTSVLGSNYQTTFTALPENSSLYIDQYDVVKGHWPENRNELIVILGENNSLTDLELYNLWLKDPEELDSMISTYQSGELWESPEIEKHKSWDYDEFIGQEFKLVHVKDLFMYDESIGFWTDKSEQISVSDVKKKGETLTIVGIARPKKDASNPSLMPGIAYTNELVFHISKEAEKSSIVKEQLENPEIDVLTGNKFGEYNDEFDMNDFFSFDEESMDDLFKFDIDNISLSEEDFDGFDLNIENAKISDYIDFNAFSGLFSGLSETALKRAFNGVTVDITFDKLSDLFTKLYDGFMEESKQSSRTDLTSLPEAVYDYFKTEDAAKVVENTLSDIVASVKNVYMSTEEINEVAKELIVGFFDYIGDREISAETLEDDINTYLATDAASSLFNDLGEKMKAEIIMIIEDADKENLLKNLAAGYSEYADKNDLPVPSEISKAFIEYLKTEEVRGIIEDAAEEMIDMETLRNNLNGIVTEVGGQVASVIETQISSAMTSIGNQIASKIESAITSMMSSYMNNLSSAFDFNPDSLEDLIQINMTEESMKNMFASMMTNASSSLSANLKKFCYSELDDPETITFYPIDFECKNLVIEMLNKYNERMEEEDEDKVIVFSDVVGSLMSSITKIINIIGYVLIAFVSISLIVSSIMIGVITYISVLERRKEIGILRAMGASKHNITQVFNCETIITGFLAGLLGVVITWIILIPGNVILQQITGEPELHAFLPLQTGLILIALSIILTTIGGLIPSKGAAKQDPVVALRTE